MYSLTLTEEQAQVISRATEFFARIQLGQIEDLGYQLLDNKKFTGLYHADQQSIRELLASIHTILVGHTCASLGMHSDDVPEQARTAWDLYQVIRQVLAWEREPEGGIQVNFHSPMQVASEPLATFKNLEANDV